MYKYFGERSIVTSIGDQQYVSKEMRFNTYEYDNFNDRIIC